MKRKFLLLSIFLSFCLPIIALDYTERSKELFAKGVELYNSGEYKKAIPLFEEADKIDKETWGTVDDRGRYSLMWLSSCYYLTGDTIKAATLSPYSQSKPIDRNKTKQIDEWNHLSDECADRKDYVGAINWLKLIVEKFPIEINSDHPVLGAYYYYLADYNMEINNFKEAHENIEKAYEIFCNTLGKNHSYSKRCISFHNSLNLKLSKLEKETRQNRIGNIPDWITHKLKQIKNLKGLMAQSNNNLKEYQNELIDIASDLKYSSEDITLEKLDEIHENLLHLNRYNITNIWKEEYRKSKDKNILDFYDLQIQIIEDLTGPLSWQKLYTEAYRIHNYRSESTLSLSPGYNTEDYERAHKFLIDWEKSGLNKSYDYWKAIHEIAWMEYLYANDLVRTANLEKQMINSLPEETVIKIFQNTGTWPLEFLLTRSLLRTGQIEEAKNWALKEYNIGLKVHSHFLKGYPKDELPGAIKQEFAYYSHDYLKCIEIGESLLTDWEKKVEEAVNPKDEIFNFLPYLSIMFEVAFQLILEKRKDTAYFVELKNKYNPLINKCQEIIDATSFPDWFGCRYLLLFPEENFTEEEKDVYEKVRSENLGNEYNIFISGNHPYKILKYLEHFSRIYSSVGAFYNKIGKYEDSHLMLKTAYTFQDMLRDSRKYLFNHHDEQSDIDIIRRYFVSLGTNKKTDEYLNFGKIIFEETKLKMLTGFSHGTRIDRSTYFSLYRKLFNTNLPTMILNNHNDTRASCLGYDLALFVKGLQLNAEMSIFSFLKENNDQEGLNLLKKYQSLNGTTKEQLKEAKELERKIIDRCTLYGDYTNGMNKSWIDVKNSLKKDEIAIEFLELVNNNPLYKDINYLLALIVNKEYDHPKCIKLGWTNKISELSFQDMYSTDSLYNIIWKPLEKELKNKKKIYFSPIGILNNLSLENIPNINSSSKKYIRLTNTQELCKRGNERKQNSYLQNAIFGGAEFNKKNEAINDSEKRYLVNENIQELNINDLNLRAGYDYLPGTYDEALIIAQKFNKGGTALYTGENASEEKLKNLSGNNIDLLHIATHGFYWNEKAIRRNSNIQFLTIGNDEEERALNRSGLLLAGANLSLRENNPNKYNDGILTAREIANLDFKNVKLVVLSACQTGLGNISQEGVFGLQRGFKKAGVKSLMMSLWKVDDNATKILMSQFYTHLLDGKSKTESLLAAQKDLRNFEKMENDGSVSHPYDSPEYWAAFVLLDALD